MSPNTQWLAPLFLVAACGFGGKDPVPAVKMYGPCDFVAECVREADICKPLVIGMGQFPNIGAVCTVECTASDQCPSEGVCMTLPGGDITTTCLGRCEAHTDCAENYFCAPGTSEDEGVVRICLPLCVRDGLPRDC